MDKRFSLKTSLTFAFLLSFLLAFSIGIARAEEGSGEDSLFLTADQAFVLETSLLHSQSIELKFKIAPGYLLYRHQFHIRNLAGKSVELPESIFPPALSKFDEALNENFFAYAKEATFNIPLTLLGSHSHIGLRVEYQGCAEGSYCYSPIAKDIVFNTTGQATIRDLSPEAFSALNTQKSIEPVLESELDYITSQLKTGSFPVIVLLFFGFGILLAFTPCILPMIPILANILVGDKAPLSSGRATLLALCYILSVALCYAIAGMTAGMMGNHWQSALQQPIYLVGFSFLLLLFALTQFNVLHIQFPQTLTHTLHQLQQRQKQGSIVGAMSMGAISALIASPCVTPALVGTLTYIGQTGNALLGGVALFSLSLGMGLPLLAVTTLGNHLLPKSGSWMKYTKMLTGLLLLLLSYSILQRAFPTDASNDLPAFTSVSNEATLAAAIEQAQRSNKRIILDVYADWCVSCRKLDQELFANQAVLSTLKETTLLRLDVTKPTKENTSLQQALKIMGPPTLLFFNQDGQEIKNLRLVGQVESQHFIDHVQQFLIEQNK